MEPPPFGSGNPRTSPGTKSSSTPFNGATAFRQWKLGYAADFPLYTVLQWSHRLSAVETGQDHVGALPIPVPSMDPPPFGSGNVDYLSHHPHRNYRPSMEPPPFGSGNWATRPTSRSTRSFNGAAAFRQWKLSWAWASSLSLKYLQWSHRLSAVDEDGGGTTADTLSGS